MRLGFVHRAAGVLVQGLERQLRRCLAQPTVALDGPTTAGFHH